MPQLSKMDGPTGLVSAKGAANALPFGQWIAQQAGRHDMIAPAFAVLNTSEGGDLDASREAACSRSGNTGNPRRGGR